MWNVNTLIETMTTFLPDMMGELEKVFREIPVRSERRKRGYEIYTSFPNASMDMSVMERAENVCLLVGEFGWADIGTWDTLYGTLPKDNEANVVMQSRCLKYGSNNNIVSVPAGKLVVLQDVDDLLVVDSGNVLMVCRKGSEQNIRKFLNDVRMKLGEEFL